MQLVLNVPHNWRDSVTQGMKRFNDHFPNYAVLERTWESEHIIGTVNFIIQLEKLEDSFTLGVYVAMVHLEKLENK